MALDSIKVNNTQVIGVDNSIIESSENLVRSRYTFNLSKTHSENVFSDYVGKNLFDVSKIKRKHLIDENTGEEYTTSANYGCTEFIKVKSSTNYFYSCTGHYIMPENSEYVFFYDSVGKYISYDSMPDDLSGVGFLTPENCVFIKLLFSTVYGLALTQLEEGISRTDYEAFKINLVKDIEFNDIPTNVFDEHISNKTGLTTTDVIKTEFDSNIFNDINPVLETVGEYKVKCYHIEPKVFYKLVCGVKLISDESLYITIDTKELWTGINVYLYKVSYNDEYTEKIRERQLLNIRDGIHLEYVETPESSYGRHDYCLYTNGNSGYDGELTFTISKNVNHNTLFFQPNLVKLDEKNRFNNVLHRYLYGCRYTEIVSRDLPNIWDERKTYKRMAIACFTDSHIDYYPMMNSGNPASIENVKDIIDYINFSKIKNPIPDAGVNRELMVIDAAVHMGDIVTTGGIRTKDFEINKLNIFFDIVKQSSVPFLYSKGNHDCNDMGNEVQNVFNDSDFSNLWYNYAETQFNIVRQTKTNGYKSTWHYKDFDEYKVRIVILDGQDTNKNITIPSDDALYDGTNNKCMYNGSNGFYISNEQFNWVVNTALNFDSKEEKDWTVIFALHQYVENDGTSRHSLKYRYEASTPKLFDACVAFNAGSTYSLHYTFDPNNTGSTDINVNPYAFFNLNVEADFTRYASLENKPKVAMWLMGHDHLDWSEDDRGIKRVWVLQSMASARSGDMRIQRIYGTSTLNAFDVILVDTILKSIRFVRYGAGITCYGEGGNRWLEDGFSY